MRTLVQELTQLDENDLRRELHSVSQSDGNRLILDGKDYINFSSNNYLGLARHPQVVEAAKQVLDHWGAGATSSRLVSGSTVLHQDLENALAAFLHQEACLLFPTGYQANLGVVTSLVGQGDAIVMDRLCHASLVDAAHLSGARLFIYKHTDAKAAEAALGRASSYRRKILITESLFSMDGDFAPVNELFALALRYNAWFLVDEAHAIGVWGEGGRGLCADTPTRQPADPTLIVVGTLSKALGSQGGFVAGTQELMDTLVNKARSFIYTTGLSPICIAAAQAALSLLQELSQPRQHLRNLSQRLRDGLKMQGWDTLKSESQIVPILLNSPASALAVSDLLRAEGFYAPAIRPPTVHAGQCRIRFSVTAAQQEQDIDLLLTALSKTNSRGSHE